MSTLQNIQSKEAARLDVIERKWQARLARKQNRATARTLFRDRCFRVISSLLFNIEYVQVLVEPGERHKGNARRVYLVDDIVIAWYTRYQFPIAEMVFGYKWAILAVEGDKSSSVIPTRLPFLRADIKAADPSYYNLNAQDVMRVHRLILPASEDHIALPQPVSL